MAGGGLGYVRLAQYVNAWLTFSHAERVSNIKVSEAEHDQQEMRVNVTKHRLPRSHVRGSQLAQFLPELYLIGYHC